MSWANSASDDSSDNDNDRDNNSDGLGRLLPRQDDDDDDADDNADDKNVVVGRTDAKAWKRIFQENLWARQCIDPIPYIPCKRDGEFFDVKISDKDLKGLIDQNGNLWFH